MSATSRGIHAGIVARSLAEAIEEHAIRLSAPMTVIPQTAERQGMNNRTRGPYADLSINRHSRDRDREQSTVDRGPVYDDGTETGTTDPTQAIHSPARRIGSIEQRIYEAEFELSIYRPIGITGQTYTRTVRDPDTGTEVTGQFEYLPSRALEQVVERAIERHDPTEGNEPLPDPREGAEVAYDEGEYGEAAYGEAFLNPATVLDLRLGRGREDDQPSRGRGDTGLRIWRQRVELEYSQFINTVIRDGQLQPITAVNAPGADSYREDVDDQWPGEFVSVPDSITPEDLEDN